MPAEAVRPLYLGLRSLCTHSLLSSLEAKAEPAQEVAQRSLCWWAEEETASS